MRQLITIILIITFCSVSLMPKAAWGSIEIIPPKDFPAMVIIAIPFLILAYIYYIKARTEKVTEKEGWLKQVPGKMIEGNKFEAISDVNVYSKPSEKSAVITVLKKDERINIIEDVVNDEGQWHKVTVQLVERLYYHPTDKKQIEEAREKYLKLENSGK